MPYTYFIGQIEGSKKPELYRTKQLEAKMRCIVPNSDDINEASVVTVRQREIMVVLGEKPPYGKVYNVLVEPRLSHVINPKWGHVHFYVDLNEDMHERVLKALRITLKRLNEMSLTAWHPVKTEIRNPQGKQLGHYSYKPNIEQDTFVLRPPAIASTRELIMTIAHECGGHGVWFRNMTSKQRASWVNLFQEYLAVKSVDRDTIKSIGSGLREAQHLRDYAKSLEINEKAELDIYLEWLKKVHNYTKFNVDDMIAAGEKLPIPDTHLFRNEIDMPITAYGKNNAEEFFAEAMGLYIIDDLSNAKIKAKIEKLAK